MDECKVIIMGFGSVGQGVANAISMKKDLIKDKTGVDIKVVAAADSSSSAISQDGLDEELLVKTKKEEGKLSAYPEFGSDKNGVDVLDAVEYDFKPEYNAIIDKGTLDALNCGDFEIVEKLIMKMEYPFNSIDLKLI